MFWYSTAFNQDISSWIVDNVTNCVEFSAGAPLSAVNTPRFKKCTP
jgi:surface protein